jgi:hypothetical protein
MGEGEVGTDPDPDPGCDEFLYGFKGAPSARRARGQARNARGKTSVAVISTMPDSSCTPGGMLNGHL